MLLGKKIWHDPKRLIAWELDGEQTSQQVFDIYSFSHITHGILVYFILRYLGIPVNYVILIAIALEITWEFIENTPYVINKYRKNSAYENYQGDSIVNMIGDILFTILGIYIAMKWPVGAIVYLVLSELVLAQWSASFLQLSIGSLL